MRYVSKIPALCLIALAACANLSTDDSAGGALVLFHGGTIYDSVDREPFEALVVSEGRVLDRGTLAELEDRHDLSGADRIDLEGGTAVPGLQDAHGHIEGYGKALEEVDLRGCKSYGELIDRVAARAAEVPSGTWITGRGWDQNLWSGKAFPEHAELSARVPEHPVFVRRVDGHAALANGFALERAGLARAFESEPDVEGGRVHLDADGRPSGVLIDTAMALVGRLVPEPSYADRRRHVLRAQEELLAMGLTCVHDMGVPFSTVGLYRELAEEGMLSMRVVAYLWGNDLASRDVLEGARLADDSDRLVVVGAKLMADGALGSRGAALLHDYADEPGARGAMRMDRAAFKERVRWLAAAGMQPATHAIGDAANRMVIDVYEEVMEEYPGLRKLRPRVEHAQIVAPADWPRFEALGILPSMQPTHCTSDMAWVPDRIGHERSDGAYAWRKFGPTERLALGSDFPVESPDPIEGIFSAITRQTHGGWPEGGFHPEERLTVREALHGFTLGAANAVFQEERRGRLAPGFACDMTVLSMDPLRVEANELLEGWVTMTVIDGELVYVADR